MASLVGKGLTQVEKEALDLARKLANVGTGESTKLGGGCIIVGDAPLLLSEIVDPLFGEVTKPACLVRHLNLNILDKSKSTELFKTVQMLATSDGSIVFDVNGDLYCGNYLVLQQSFSFYFTFLSLVLSFLSFCFFFLFFRC
jgi:hypothetical protein